MIPFSPTSTNDTYTPHDSSAPPATPDLAEGKRADGKGKDQRQSPTIRQADTNADTNANANADADKEAANKPLIAKPMPRSEPSYRNDEHPEANKQVRQGSPALPAIITHSAHIENSSRGDRTEISKRIHGQGLTELHIALDRRDAKAVRELLAAGAHPGSSTGVSLSPPAIASEEWSALPALLFRATKQGWTEGVEALAGFVSLTREQQYELMGKWVSSANPTSATLAAISPLIPVDLPSVRSLMKNPRLLEVPFDAGSPELLRAMLDFFDRRVSFNSMIQASVSQLIDDGGKLIDADMGRTLLRFVVPRVSRLVNDKETVMRLLQLSEQLQDYTLVTEIKALNSSGTWLARKNIPLDPTSISDPVSREFLGLPKSAESQTKISGFLNTLKLLVSAPAEMPAVDGARLSNDLILALKSDAVGDEIDKVFDDHRISAIVSQGLKPLLQDLATQLTPDASTRVDAVCRFLIAYAFSRLAEDWRLTRHRAFELTQSHPQWQAMKQKIDAEIASFEDVAATILDTMSSEMLGASLPDVVTRLTLEAMNARSMEASLRGAFRTKLGLLDVPALRLAQACVSASRTWQAGSASSTAASAGTQNGSDALTALIRQAFAAQTRVAHLPKEFVDVSRQIDLDLVDDFNNLVWWQMDMVAAALGIDEPAPADDDSDHVISDSDDGVEPKENEKSRYRQSA